MLNYDDGVYWIDTWNFQEFDIDYSDETDSCPFPPYMKGWYIIYLGKLSGPFEQKELQQEFYRLGVEEPLEVYE